MFVELHIIQNFAPSNLNRDDRNAPKDCEFGGYRRARISSQCIKRATRELMRDRRLVSGDLLACRTKRVVQLLTEGLKASGLVDTDATRVTRAAVAALFGIQEDDKTPYLLFLGATETDALARTCLEEADALRRLADKLEGLKSDQVKKAAQELLPAPLREGLRRCLKRGKAVDLALFGRMVSDMPDAGVDAACQVAHAISTHKVTMDFDFYTAVDDKNPADTSGAGMMGTIEFNSACFYRYCNVDMEQLKTNLDGDEELAREALTAFLRATTLAVPTGKQNSMAAQNPPSFVMTVVRNSTTWSLSNAFVQPVRADHTGDLVRKSIEALVGYWGRLASAYGGGNDEKKAILMVEDAALGELGEARVANLDTLVANTVGSVSFGADGRT